MGLLSGPRTVERRDAFPYPAIPPNSQAGLTSLRSVSLARTDSALQKVAIWASVNLICSMGSMLPINVYRGVGPNRQQITPPAWFGDIGGQQHGTPDFIWQLLYCGCLRGNVVGEVLDRVSTTGQPSQIDLKHPDEVSVTQPVNGGRLEWRFNGKLVPTQDVWHRRIYPTPGRTLGLSPIAMHAVTISQGLYAQNFGAQWFLDGAHPSSVLTNDKAQEIDQSVAQTVKQRFLAAVRGTREPVVLGGGWKYQAIQITPGESQFLETQGFTSAECARIYGPGMPEILGYETGNSMTYANIEQRSIDLLKYTLDPWLTRVERWLSELLPQPQYARFDRDALLRTDALSRFQKHQIALRNGIEVINEIRDEEHLPPVEWGTEPYLPAMGPSAAAAAEKDDPPPPGTDPAIPQGGQQ